jgi:hypothetical protein
MEDPAVKFAIYIFILVYSCILHECAHERMGILPLLFAAYFLAPYAIRPFARFAAFLLAQLFPPEYAGALVRAFFS